MFNSLQLLVETTDAGEPTVTKIWVDAKLAASKVVGANESPVIPEADQAAYIAKTLAKLGFKASSQTRPQIVE